MKCISCLGLSGKIMQTLYKTVTWSHKNKLDITLRKKWSQNGASEEPFWKMAPLCQRGAIVEVCPNLHCGLND